ncbi:MAG: 50S ribosomal protein L19 [Candidatus Sungiibacteriota bacterium]
MNPVSNISPSEKARFLTGFTKKSLRSDIPDVRAGDTIRLFQKIKEGDKERLQPFEGLVIAKKHGRGVTATITVRKVAAGIGVERVFPLHSPTIEKIEVIKRSKVRRAKLYYIREKAAKEVRKRMQQERVSVVKSAVEVEAAGA